MRSAEMHGSGDARGPTSQSTSEAGQHRQRTTALDLQLFSQPPLAARIISAPDRPSATQARKGENADSPVDAQDVVTEDASEVRPEDDRLRILILCNYDPYNAATVCEHINSFYEYSIHEVFILSKIGDLPENFSFDPFDVILIHYSIFIAVDAYMSPATRSRLSRFSGAKMMFIQDEYRFVNRTIAAINECGIDVVFTCVPPGEIAKVYPPDLLPNVGFINVLTGYVPEGLKLFQPRPLAERSITVGYRGRVYPAWHGEAGREKHDIGRRFLADAKRYGVKCDIAWDEDSRIYGIHWVKFIQNCRAMLAVESGASVFDFDGSISATVETFTALLGLSGKPNARVRQFLSQSGPFAKHPEARELYEALRDIFFKEKENLVDLAQLSPRVFEAATLKTLLIMYEGSYSGAFKPWRHYVPLRKDHSNMAEVVDILNNPVECAKIISNCYVEVCENEDYSYKKFISKFDRVVEYICAPHNRSIVPRFTREDMHRFQQFYHIHSPYSLDLVSLKRLPNNPLQLIRQMVAPKPNELGLKDIIRKIGWLR
mgnify:FL=1